MSDYRYYNQGSWDNEYILSPLTDIVQKLNLTNRKLFEVGFGNGWTANHFSNLGYDVSGIEPSETGVEIARKNHPELNLALGNVYQDLTLDFGQFPIVYSVEVIEHVQFPKKFAKSVFNLLEESGTAIITTPYHGYLKNLAIALLNRCDNHYDPLWDEGHLRFFSERTLSALLLDVGFRDVNIIRVGRNYWLAKSMIAIAKK